MYQSFPLVLYCPVYRQTQPLQSPSFPIIDKSFPLFPLCPLFLTAFYFLYVAWLISAKDYFHFNETFLTREFLSKKILCFLKSWEAESVVKKIFDISLHLPCAVTNSDNSSTSHACLVFVSNKLLPRLMLFPRQFFLLKTDNTEQRNSVC